MYLTAARLQPSQDLDPDVQTGLGVLLNLSGDFDKVWCTYEIIRFSWFLQLAPLLQFLGSRLFQGCSSDET